MAEVTATVRGISGGFLSAGGYTNGPVRRLFPSLIDSANCSARTLRDIRYFGLGLSINYARTTVDIECPEDHPPCEFQPGDEVNAVQVTLLFITLTRWTFRLCRTEQVFSVGLGLGLEGHGVTFRVT